VAVNKTRALDGTQKNGANSGEHADPTSLPASGAEAQHWRGSTPPQCAAQRRNKKT
jgi:hypothetical protein